MSLKKSFATGFVIGWISGWLWEVHIIVAAIVGGLLWSIPELIRNFRNKNKEVIVNAT